MLTRILCANKYINSVSICLLWPLLVFPICVSAELFKIPVQSMDSALRVYSIQSKRQVFFLPLVTKGIKNQPIVGEYNSDIALKALLKNTGLTYKKDSRG